MFKPKLASRLPRNPTDERSRSRGTSNQIASILLIISLIQYYVPQNPYTSSFRSRDDMLTYSLVDLKAIYLSFSNLTTPHMMNHYTSGLYYGRRQLTAFHAYILVQSPLLASTSIHCTKHAAPFQLKPPMHACIPPKSTTRAWTVLLNRLQERIVHYRRNRINNPLCCAINPHVNFPEGS